MLVFNAKILQHAHTVVLDIFLTIIMNVNYVDQPVVLVYQLLSVNFVKEHIF